MALAVLKYEGGDESSYRFRADIGKNRFYLLAVGGEEVARSGGLKMLAEPRHVAPLAGPLNEAALGRFTLEVPRHLLDREHASVQLMSFRNERREGPAVSEIVKVPVRLAAVDALPELTFARNVAMSSQYHPGTNGRSTATRSTRPAEAVPFSYREREWSSGMFLDSLVSLLPRILPGVGSLFGGLFGGGGVAAPAGGGAASAALPFLQLLNDPRAAALLNDLLRNLGVAGASNGGAARPGVPVAAAHGYNGGNGHASLALARHPEYSEAAAIPAALLAALPALMPLLQQALNPETVKAVLGALDPSKLLGVVTNSIKDLGNLGIQSHEQDLKHLQALTPSTGPPVDSLLTPLSLAASSGEEVRYARDSAVALQFDDVHSLTLGGRPRLAYRRDQDISFPLSVRAPRAVGKALLQLVVKCPKTLRILHSQKHRLESVQSGRLAATPRLSVGDLGQLEQGEDYLVCASLVWKRKNGEKVGTGLSQLITLVGEFSYDRVEESSELIPLSNVEQHRDYWHQVWTGGFDNKLRRVIFDCKYYFAFEPDRDAVGRMETLVKIDEKKSDEQHGRLKSGMVLGPFALNALIPQISSHPTLGEAELAALRSPDFAARGSMAARAKVKLHGRPGTGAALWVYPEVKMQRVILKKAGEVNEAGHVLGFTEEAVHFPLPALIHLIGATT